jgi:hypothetical protein
MKGSLNAEFFRAGMRWVQASSKAVEAAPVCADEKLELLD